MKTVKQNLTAAQIRLLDRVILANGLNDNLTFRSLTTREQKSLYNLRNKALYIYVDSDDKLRLNVSRMINDTDFINYVASKKQDVISEKMDRLKKAREEQSVANFLIRKVYSGDIYKHTGNQIRNQIWSFYGLKESRARLEESKKAIKEERNEILDLCYDKLDYSKTYTYSLDNYDYPFKSKLK
tara:strand:+ start:466 stop:1017 length:552 start_codon:yes stop_codon:yes gene_type:complete